MRRFPGMILVVGLCVGSVSAAQDSGRATLTGTWDDVTPERERVGYRMARPKVSLTIAGDACSWKEEGGRTFRQSLFTPGATDPHRSIDFVTVSGGTFQTTHALFKVEGDLLTIKEAGLGRPRPTDLVSEDFGTGKMEDWAPVYTYKRRPR